MKPNDIPVLRLPPDIAGGVVVGELLALVEGGTIALVRRTGQAGEAVLRARTTVDLHAPHIGATVLLVFENGDPDLPIVIGVLRGGSAWPVGSDLGTVEIDVQGERLIVSAREQLVLRCGKASITLTRAGKVLLEGSYVLSRASGVNRIDGGSVQIN